jgi:hypothetical protein
LLVWGDNWDFGLMTLLGERAFSFWRKRSELLMEVSVVAENVAWKKKKRKKPKKNETPQKKFVGLRTFFFSFPF